jgi:hypothetical protein
MKFHKPYQSLFMWYLQGLYLLFLDRSCQNGNNLYLFGNIKPIKNVARVVLITREKFIRKIGLERKQVYPN